MNNQDKYDDLLPTDAVPMFGLRILAYYDTKGQMQYKVSTDENGSTPIISLIGTLEMVKVDIAQKATQLGRGLRNE